jgi:hypothetical protein
MKISLFPGTYISSKDASSGGSILEDDFDIIFIACFMDKKSSKVSSSICCNFYFLGFFSLTPKGLSRFRRGVDSFATMLPFFLQEFQCYMEHLQLEYEI